jgi:hypothetical protein
MDYFPSWRYHRTEAPRLINDALEESTLGDEWADTPAAFAALAPLAETIAPPAEGESPPRLQFGRSKTEQEVS